MTLANAEILYAHFIKIGRKPEAENLLIRYPELKEESMEEEEPADAEQLEDAPEKEAE